MKNRLMKGAVCVVLSAAMIIAGCSASWISTALADLPVITQVALNIASLLGANNPNAATQVQAIAKQVGSDLTLVQSLISDYQGATAAEKPALVQKIAAALSDVQSNLNAILSAVHVNDPALQATVVAAVGVAVTTVTSIMSLLPASAGTVRANNPVKPPSAKELKKEFNAIFVANGFPQAQLK